MHVIDFPTTKLLVEARLITTMKDALKLISHPWLEYFIEGMALSCERIVARLSEAAAQGSADQSQLIRKLDPRQRRALELFQKTDVITSRDIAELFGFKPRTSALLCASWVASGFLTVLDPSNKGRTYMLAQRYQKLITP